MPIIRTLQLCAIRLCIISKVSFRRCLVGSRPLQTLPKNFNICKSFFYKLSYFICLFFIHIREKFNFFRRKNNNFKVLNNLFQLFQFDLGQLLFICILTICFYGFMVLVLLMLLFSFQKQTLICWAWLLCKLYALGTQSNYYCIRIQIEFSWCYFFAFVIFLLYTG